ncbi:MAG: peptidoglycan DD-metalloendopeptidase family protein [Coleofasciculaceae cyanobacterium SM2_1_6]|nr:peptidoglycan DD-metalloendopeptidase family protein [Coleofasciculaceae cyanobacterium SM2_1_6]
MGKLVPFLSSLSSCRFLSSLGLLALGTYFGITTPLALRAEAQPSSPCSSVFARLRSHQISPGETLESIANRYGLVGQTLFSFNPNLQRGLPAIGTEILIPPFNGIAIPVTAGTTWAELSRRYGVRADILFELNGCQSPSSVVFLPGINWTATGTPQRFESRIDRYPLAPPVRIILRYGFYSEPNELGAEPNQLSSQLSNQLSNQFHSGLDLAAPLGTEVVAAGNGVVAFAGEQNPWGNLVVINHGEGQQSRYAHLGEIRVTMGQQVRSGDVLGTVGNTGNVHSAEPHLHFEIRINSPAGALAQDPELYLSPLENK